MAFMIRVLISLFILSKISHASAYDPGWAAVIPKRVIQHAESNGTALVKAVEALEPGDRLEIAAGTYSIPQMWDVRVSGTAEAPIWIVAAEGARVVITRPDEKQNIINIGQAGAVSHLCLRGIEFTGGSHGMRLGHCSEVWIDQCHIHHTGQVCLSANSADTRRLFLTRNHIHDGNGHGEGMYLGGNHASFTMSESIIALNHIHDCRGDQGDGIEVKQGSWGNLIAENHVHDTNYPCITVYGTGGKPVNIIERNLCYRSGDSVIQMQGEAIVRNNILIAGKHSGLASTDHQGRSLHLQVLHNTIVNTATAFSGSSWNAREGMVLANNILYSKEQNALNFPNGSEGVTITGNIVSGHGPKDGCHPGRGIQDLPGLTWNADKTDAAPAADAPLEKAEAKFLLSTDFKGAPRLHRVSGAVSP